MKKKISVGVTIISVLVTAVLTFQATYVVLRNKYGHLISSIKADESNSIASRVADFDELFRSYYIRDIDDDKLIDSVLKGYVAGTGDTYAEYMTEEEYASFMESMSGEYQGIGITVTQNSVYNCIEVISVLPDSPADEAGVKVGDLIGIVGGEYVSDIGYNVAVSKLRGLAGTKADFTVFRGDDHSETAEFSIEREYMESLSVESRVYDGVEGKIGVIDISSFDAKTPDQFKVAVGKVIDDGAEAIVFDVRNNPGGELNSVVSILDYLLPEGPIIRISDSQGNETTIDSDENEINIPMAVIVNGSTASAAELFTAALKDYEKAVVVGTTTYGKGSMQTILSLPDDSALKVTYRLYSPPFSENYDGVGIKPDVEIEPDLSADGASTVTDENDNQLQRAFEVLCEYISN